MSTHRWTHGKPLVRHDADERIKQGETFDPSESELRAFGDRIKEAESDGEDDSGAGASATDASDEEVPFHPADKTVDELQEELGDVTATETAEAVLDLERDHDDRDTAVDAIEARIEDLAEDDKEVSG